MTICPVWGNIQFYDKCYCYIYRGRSMVDIAEVALITGGSRGVFQLGMHSLDGRIE